MQLKSIAQAFATALAVGAPPLVIFVMPALALVARNIEYFSDGYAAGSRFYFVAAAWLAVGTTATWTWPRARSCRYIASLYLLSAPLWAVHGLTLQLTRAVVASLVIATCWLIGSALATRASRPTLVQYCAIAAVPLLVGNAWSVVQAGEIVEEDRQTVSEKPLSPEEPEGLPNIYHLIFDEYQTDVFERLLDDHLRQELRSFVLYRDTIATYGRTELSLSSMFSRSDYTYESPPAEFVARALTGPESALRALGDLGYHRVGYLHHAGWVGGDSELDQYFLHDDIVDLASLPGYESLLASLWFHINTPDAIGRHVIPQHHQTQLADDAILPEDVPPRSVSSLRKLVEHEPDLAGQGRYTLGHFIVPHFPYVMTPQCRYVPGETTGPLEQAECVNMLIGEFLETLRDLGRLDSSIVLIHSDHGSWYDLDGDDLIRLADDGYFTEEASWARARSLLLLHAPSLELGDEPELVVSDRATTLDDIMPTIFDELGVSETFSGGRFSLLEEGPEDRPRYYHFYRRQRDGTIVRGPLVRYRVTDDGVELDREIDLPSAE